MSELKPLHECSRSCQNVVLAENLEQCHDKIHEVIEMFQNLDRISEGLMLVATQVKINGLIKVLEDE